MKDSELSALRVLQATHFEAVRKQQLYARMCDEVQREIRESVALVVEVAKADPRLGEKLAHVHDTITRILSETDR